MSLYQNKPDPFFDLVIHNINSTPGITGASSGYEKNEFRNSELADYIIEWLPDFALPYSELEDLNSGSAIRLMKQAAKTVYTTDKYSKRGEFGEILLHALLREVFDSEPAISKIFYKTANNETVKGFDAVHVVENGEDLELWLGEVKFYKDAQAAIRDISAEIREHTKNDYLRDEFLLISNKLDPNWPHSKKLKDLISKRTSLDKIFKRICIPAMLTYESPCVGKNSEDCEEFATELTEEMQKIYEKFSGGQLPDIRVHLFLVPLHQKKDLIDLLHNKLEGMQR